MMQRLYSYYVTEVVHRRKITQKINAMCCIVEIKDKSYILLLKNNGLSIKTSNIVFRVGFTPHPITAYQAPFHRVIHSFCVKVSCK